MHAAVTAATSAERVTASIPSFEDALAGVLLGTAVGDAIGLPREGLSARRAARMFGPPPLSHRFLLGRGMISDDTEHACMVAQSLLAAGDGGINGDARVDAERFARSLAWRLRGWLLALPAGVGLATARATLKLWLGFGPTRSGVNSAGNGPAMRAAILGVYAPADQPDWLRAFVRASTRITHTHPDAEAGALAIALAARHGSVRGSDGVHAGRFAAELRESVGDCAISRAVDGALAHLDRGAPIDEYAASLGIDGRVSGWINHTVPVALYAWLASPGDVRRAVESVVTLGGDADTTGAITGALAGATAGAGAIPRDWLDGLSEWPRSVAWMRQLASALAKSHDIGRGGSRPVPLAWPGLLPRNVLFLVLVLLHGFRRLLPPY